jgi:hypothetical protein
VATVAVVARVMVAAAAATVVAIAAAAGEREDGSLRTSWTEL